MSNPQDPGDRLRETLHFTEKDLIANRAGQLSQAQRDEYKQYSSVMRSSALITILVECVFLGVLAFVFLAGSLRRDVLLPVIIFTVALLGYTVMRALNSTRTSDAPPVETVEGIVHLTPIPPRNGTLTGYVMEIGGLKFVLYNDRGTGFVDQSPYRVYYVKVPGSNGILTAEAIDPVALVR